MSHGSAGGVRVDADEPAEDLIRYSDSSMVQAPGPILVADRFPVIEGKLMSLLRNLAPDEWDRPTVVSKWRVRQVVAHLLDTQLRKISRVRDGHVPASLEPPPRDLVALINRLNAEGVAFYTRLSPQVLLALLEAASREFCEFHQKLDPFATAAFAVSWAGEAQSFNWFDTAREFTERWLHQQQIRDAVDRPGIMVPDLYHPVLDCFMRSLPYAYREIPGEPGTCLEIRVTGDCGGRWFLCREDFWELSVSAHGQKVSEIEIPQAIAWRIFTKCITRDDAERRIKAAGQEALARHVLRALAIVG